MSCIMKGCTNSKRSSKHLNFFKLPPMYEKRKQWLDVCEAECSSKFPVVCSMHFRPSQIYTKGTRKRLHPDAVPISMTLNTRRSVQGTITKLNFREKNSENRLAATELEIQEKEPQEKLPEFQLEPDDDYDDCCGEVFVTYSGVLVFHCSPCGKKYGSFIHFVKHLSTEHYQHVKEEFIHNEYETISSENLKKSISVDNSICEEDREIKQEYDLQEFMKIEIQPTVFQSTEDPFNEIEQILIQETDHCKETDIEYEELSGEEKTVDTTCIFSNKEKLEEEEQSLFEAENPSKSKRKKNADKIFKCDVCNKILKNVYILRRHALVHSSERKYKCEICGLRMKHYSYIKRHMLRHTGEKNISCDICSKKFYTNSEHKLHIRSHTGERPFVCSSCGLAFTNSGALTVHEKTHKIEPLFRCHYCDKGFYSEYRMKSHMVMHTKERPFICPICSASFPRKRSMLRHIDLRHKKSALKKEI